MKSKKVKRNMIEWILLLSIASFIIGYIVNTFFVYIPIARIEKQIDKAVNNVDKVSADLDRVGRAVDQFINSNNFNEKLDIIIRRLDNFEIFCNNSNGASKCKK